MPLLLFFHLAHKVTKTGNVCVSVCKLFAHYRPPELVRWKVRTHTHRKFVYTLQEVGRVLTRRRGRSSSRLTACNRAIMSKRRRRIKPVDDAKTYILSCTDKSGFMSRLIDSFKGRGVFATQPIEPGDFVLEYRGKLLTQEECQSLTYSEIDSTFLFDFEWQNRHLCLDASKEDGSLGRLVNDNHKNPNCVMRKIIVNNKPHLCLFALKKIEIGSEIDYSYGDAKWPWRSMVKTPAAAETETSPLPQMFHMESKPDETNAQVKDPQTPAAAETETSPLPQMFHMESKPDETNAQVKDPQTPAAAETETSPLPQMFHMESKPDETNAQVKDPQTPAAAETETSPLPQMFHMESKPDETNAQVKDPQTPAAAETETSPLPQMFHMESKPDETNVQKLFNH
uniref:N-lysine methyltransferase KMT5A-B-like n=1 Tax=Solea senegalensis TaxID=28829 RepID=UPI001CD8C3B1|nr:N-lysine methyltransferase KMT5A-B-like [Solea senegalensis]